MEFKWRSVVSALRSRAHTGSCGHRFLCCCRPGTRPARDHPFHHESVSFLSLTQAPLKGQQSRFVWAEGKLVRASAWRGDRGQGEAWGDSRQDPRGWGAALSPFLPPPSGWRGFPACSQGEEPVILPKADGLQDGNPRAFGALALYLARCPAQALARSPTELCKPPSLSYLILVAGAFCSS